MSGCPCRPTDPACGCGAVHPEPVTVHQYAAPFRSLCGITGAHKSHGDRSKVTCPACLAMPDDVAARADYDQLVAAMRGVVRTEGGPS